MYAVDNERVQLSIYLSDFRNIPHNVTVDANAAAKLLSLRHQK